MKRRPRPFGDGRRSRRLDDPPPRLRRSWRQADLARQAGISQSAISRLERGHVDGLSIGAVRRVLTVLDVRLDLVPRWRGGDLERVLNATHNDLHETLTRRLGQHRAWIIRSEASFSHYGERGIIDVLAWHPTTRSLLVIELKSDLVDPGGLIGQVDRYRRLAPPSPPRPVGPCGHELRVVVADTWANRHLLAAHLALLGGRFPIDGRSIDTWLERPSGSIEALSFVLVNSVRIPGHRKRVRTPHVAGVALGSRGSSTPVSTS